MEHQGALVGTQLSLSSHWHPLTGVLQEYLVPATQDAFQATVTEFLYLPWKHAQDKRASFDASQVRIGTEHLLR